MQLYQKKRSSYASTQKPVPLPQTDKENRFLLLLSQTTIHLSHSLHLHPIINNILLFNQTSHPHSSSSDVASPVGQTKKSPP